ncbi:MAG: metallophosphoesterase [Oscillospiraceae bacterium]|nr:metallophosphoesterase [Oscillospiraceae bacterium]
MSKGYTAPRKKKKIIVFSVVLAVAALLLIPGLYNGLCIQKYQIEDERINNTVRIAHISDLHSCKYGRQQENLIKAIDSQTPDVILMTGDMFDDGSNDENTEFFLQGIYEKYPCYYVTGNHEFYSEKEQFYEKMSMLEQYGVTILSGETNFITLNGETINICGVDDPYSYRIDNTIDFNAQLHSTSEQSDNGNFTILLSHRPELFEIYTEYDFDLVLCGHAHGGQWRIPWILNGLYAPNQGFFPEYAGGLYEKNDTTMIVSRGLSNCVPFFPRIYNRPELCIIDIK